MSTITVMRPDVEATVATQLHMVERFEPRANLRLAIIENGKPKARAILTAISEELQEYLPGLSIEMHHKASASWPVSAKEAEAIAASCDLVIAGVGDCGGCSASSLADAVAIERAGKPATVIITEAFQGLAASYARRLGAPGYPCVVLPHPVSSRSDEELRVFANKAVPTVFNLLTTG